MKSITKNKYSIKYRVFIWNLGKLIVYYSRLFFGIWAKTYVNIFLCIGILVDSDTMKISDTSKNVELVLTKSLKEKNRRQAGAELCQAQVKLG
jgi:hypothetical protein